MYMLFRGQDTGGGAATTIAADPHIGALFNRPCRSNRFLSNLAPTPAGPIRPHAGIASFPGAALLECLNRKAFAQAQTTRTLREEFGFDLGCKCASFRYSRKAPNRDFEPTPNPRTLNIEPETLNRERLPGHLVAMEGHDIEETG
jgi:hypothetical protein